MTALPDDRTPEALQRWLGDLMVHPGTPNARALIQIPSMDAVLMILDLAKATSSPVDEEQAWDFMSTAPRAVWSLVERLQGRGRPYTRMLRIIVGWLLAEGWPMPKPVLIGPSAPGQEPLYDEAVADVILWHANEGLSISPKKVDRLAATISLIRLAIARGVDDRPPHNYNDHGRSFTVTDDAGLTWRIWSQIAASPYVELVENEVWREGDS